MYLVCDWKDQLNHYHLPSYYRRELLSLCRLLGLELAFCSDASEWPDLNKIKVYVGNKPEVDLLRSSSLRWIHFGSVGTDRIDSNRAKELGITITNSRGIFDDAVSLHSLSRLLNRLVPSQNFSAGSAFDRNHWEQCTIKSNSAMFHVLGHGPISQRLCLMLSALGLDVKAYTRSPHHYNAVYDVVHFDYEKKSDDASNNFVINLLPATSDTLNFADNLFFKKFTNIFYYLNVGRPQTESLSDIQDLLRTGFIRSAGWDVIRDYNTVSTLTREFGERLDFTPHIAAFARDHWDNSFGLLQRNLMLFKTQEFELMENIVNG